MSTTFHSLVVQAKNAFHVPESVTKLTSVYQTKSGLYQGCLNGSTVKGAHTNQLEWTHVWTAFCHWFRGSSGIEHMPKKVEAHKRFESELFTQKLVKGVWAGWLMPKQQSRWTS